VQDENSSWKGNASDPQCYCFLGRYRCANANTWKLSVPSTPFCIWQYGMSLSIRGCPMWSCGFDEQHLLMFANILPSHSEVQGSFSCGRCLLVVVLCSFRQPWLTTQHPVAVL
jgi:hypothetical protein